MKEEILKTIENNKLVKINDKIYLTNYQLEVLNKYEIPSNVNSIKEILFYIDEVLEQNDALDLEEIAHELEEFDYYNNTNK